MTPKDYAEKTGMKLRKVYDSLRRGTLQGHKVKSEKGPDKWEVDEIVTAPAEEPETVKEPAVKPAPLTGASGSEETTGGETTGNAWDGVNLRGGGDTHAPIDMDSDEKAGAAEVLEAIVTPMLPERFSEQKNRKLLRTWFELLNDELDEHNMEGVLNEKYIRWAALVGIPVYFFHKQILKIWNSRVLRFWKDKYSSSIRTGTQKPNEERPPDNTF